MTPNEVVERITEIKKDVEEINIVLKEFKNKKGLPAKRICLGSPNWALSEEFYLSFSKHNIAERVTKYTLSLMRKEKRQLESELDKLYKRIK